MDTTFTFRLPELLKNMKNQFFLKKKFWSQITIVIVYILILNGLTLKYSFKKSVDLFHL